MSEQPEVTIYRSTDDDVWVVQIDTDGEVDPPELRVWVNEALVCENDHCLDLNTT